MIFNEKAFIRLLKRTLKTGLIYGYIDERYIFGGDNWRAYIHQDYVTQNILGELMKLTGLYPRPGSVFTVNKEKMAQYTFTDPGEFEVPLDGMRMGVTDIVLNDYMRVTSQNKILRMVFEDFIHLFDKDYVSDEEDMYEGPFYSPTEEKYYWKNDTCLFKVVDEYKDIYNETLEKLQECLPLLPIAEKYTFHNK